MLELLTLMELPNVTELSYPVIPDNVSTTNDNVELLSERESGAVQRCAVWCDGDGRC